ncbi:hypothetical protein CK203_060832 [Vitis vinifera]|uniref:Uncharacterized protein n=1 Tax=Vitis vinifera TaxID=29760 RepID=A0A438GAJ0_VITVI|nr:hypothetical protein CK203_060832 [Vitis vinifera]
MLDTSTRGWHPVRRVLVSCSAGNSGPDLLTVVSVAPWILTDGVPTIDKKFSGGCGSWRRENLRFRFIGKPNPSQVLGKAVICDRNFTSAPKVAAFSNWFRHRRETS